MVPAAGEIVRFGLFELELKAGLLRKNGLRIRLPQQPLQVLSLLVERPGEIVTRQELRQRLWTEDVFVDFDHGLNKSVQKLRDALGDSAESSRYIETVPRVGYRFIAPVQRAASPNPTALPIDELQEPIPAASAAPALEASSLAPIALSPSTHKPRAKWLLWLAPLALLGAGALWFAHRRPPAVAPIHSIAILPLDNLSGDPNQEYFADGMTDELTTMLAKASTLRIISRTSVMQYKGAHRPIREIAEALGVDGILEGSISRSGDKVHMTIQLIHASSDTHVWAESYDRDAKDVAALPQEAAQAIATRLGSAIPQPAARYVNPEAHDAYLHGKYLWYVGNLAALQYFKRAIELQPDYAPGWAGLAMYYDQGAWGDGLVPLQALPQGEVAAIKALQLEPSSPESHLVMAASNLFYRWDLERADQEVRRAIELDPRDAEAYEILATVLVLLNRNREAIEARKKADELDPFGRPYAMAMVYNWARQYDAAIENSNQHLQATPQDPNMYFELYVSYRGKGMEREAVQALVKGCSLAGDPAADAIKNAFQHGGYTAVLHWRLNEFEAKASKQYVSPVDLAIFHAELAQREPTLSLLEKALHDHDPSILFIQTEPAFDFLHTDERYRAIVQRVGLPPAW